MNSVKEYEGGLRLTVTTVSAFRSVAVGLWVAAGSVNETPKNNGISHFIEHNIFKGTDKYSAFDIAREFDKVGASVNAFTGKEATCYYFKSIDSAVERCFEIMSDMFFQATFVKEELDRERKVIVEEINMVEDNPEDLGYDLIAQLMFGDSPLSKTILGPAKNVLGFEKPDIENYIEETYCPENTVISMAGNITIEEADALVRKYILPRLRHRKSCKKIYKPMPFKGGYGSKIKDFEQSTISIAYPSVSSEDPLSPTQNVLNIVLGNGMSSRLFQRIREKLGLAYSVYTMPSPYTYTGIFGIYLNVARENAARAVKETKEELVKLMTEGITEDELALAKAQLISAAVFAQENLLTMMNANGKKLALTGKEFDLDKLISDVTAVKCGAVTEFARKIFSSPNVGLAYVGKEIGEDLLAIIR